MFLSTQTHVSSDLKKVSLSMWDTRLQGAGGTWFNIGRGIVLGGRRDKYSLNTYFKNVVTINFSAIFVFVCLSPPDESVPDVKVSLDVGRKESLRTVEDVHQDGQFCLLQMTPFIIDVCHHILHCQN